MRLFLIRHAETDWNRSQRAQGHNNTPLNETGLEQANQLADFLFQEKVQRILSSDLLRCTQTVEPLAQKLGVAIESSALLRERSFGDWEGRGYTEIRNDLRAVDPENPEHVRPPNGESVLDVWERVHQFVGSDMFLHEEATLIATHGGTKALLLSHLLQGTYRTARSFKFPNCSLTELVQLPTRDFNLVRFASTQHLASNQPIGAYGNIG